MNLHILEKEVRAYLLENSHCDVRDFSLRKSPFPQIKSSELAQQLKGFQVAKYKFPFFNQSELVYFPPSLNLEQASSWSTAVYKAGLLKGKSIIDLTAGMGVDAYAFSFHFEKVTALERNSELVEVSKHNYKVLNRDNLEYINTEFESYFHQNPDFSWDVIYVDPSRRIGSERKVLLEDLEPNVQKCLGDFLKRSKIVLVKLSPLLDLKSTLDKIPQIQEIHIVALKNEVKELLLLCREENSSNFKIKAVNLDTDQAIFEFYMSEEAQANSEFSAPLKYIYEPNAAILKSGAFKLIGQKFSLKKLHVNTHLYTSEEYRGDFPGKVFEVQEELKNPKKQFDKRGFHIISKNHPLSVDLIRKKYKLKEGAEQTLIFTQSVIDKHILLCERIL